MSNAPQWTPVSTPPTEDGEYLCVHGSGKIIIGTFCVNSGWNYVLLTHWMSLPDPPPKPDAFEAWWDSLTIFTKDPGVHVVAKQCVSREFAKLLWDAAAKATKEHHD